MEALVDLGLVRDIGVSNFSAVKLAALMDGGLMTGGAAGGAAGAARGGDDDDKNGGNDGSTMVMGECRIKPSVNQVECGAHFR